MNCPDCDHRLIQFYIGCPYAAAGSYTLHGCPSCGRVIFQYDDANCLWNPIQMHYNASCSSQYMISS